MDLPVPFVDLRPQYEALREELDAAIARVVASQWFILGPEVEAFESAMAGYLASPNTIGCASGTDALLLALRALELEPGDEIVIPAFTFFATAGAVWNAGFRPVFADIEPETCNVTAGTIAPALTDRSRALIPVHLFGQMAEMEPLRELAGREGLAIVEDAAQAIGARQVVQGTVRQAGTVGHIGCYSFFPSKNLGGFGDGGLLATADDALAARLRKLRVHGGQQMYHHEMVGTNSRLDALQAAVLAVKLSCLDQWIDARREHARAYDDAFADLAPAVRTPVTAAGNHHTYNVYTLRVERRDALKEHLDARGIGNAIYYPVPLHLQACFAELGYRRGDLPVCEQAAHEVISLPVFPEMNPAQRDEVIAAVRDFFR